MMSRYIMDMKGHTMDMSGPQNLHIKSEVSDTIRHDMSHILKYLCIIGPDMLNIGIQVRKIAFYVKISSHSSLFYSYYKL